ncbi:MAG: hypothetical protein ABI905_11845 [Betaproteobacteria bacterium]
MSDARIRRLPFALLGLPAIVNALAMLVVAFNTTFRMGSGYRWLLPFTAALVCMALALYFAIKRGRDIGWQGPFTAGILLVSTAMLPALLLPLGILLFMRGKASAHAQTPTQTQVAPAGSSSMRTPGLVLLAVLLAALPWTAMLLLKIV